MYQCTRACIALGYDYTRRVQVKPKERYEFVKQVRNKVTLKNGLKTIHIDRQSFENNFVNIK